MIGIEKVDPLLLTVRITARGWKESEPFNVGFDPVTLTASRTTAKGKKEEAELAEFETEILEWLKDHPESSTRVVVKGTGKNRDNVKVTLDNLKQRGIVVSEPGPRGSILWSLPSE